MWTLVYNGEEKTLADWGIAADIERERLNKQKGVFRCRTIEDFDPAGGPQFEYRAAMTVWRDRTGIGAGGTIYFQGFWDDARRVLDGGRQFLEYVAFDVWWLFERQIFMQQRRQFSGTEGHLSTGAYVYDWKLGPEVYLGELLNAEAVLLLQTNGEQIVEIVNWLNETYNPTKRGAAVGRDNAQDVVQIGTIEPRSQVPVERASGLYCSEAITRVLRLQPDTVISLDHTTAPPTLNVRTFAKWNYGTTPPTFVDYTNLPELTIDITADQERQVSIQARHAAQLAGVAIYYRKMVTVDEVTAPQMFIDKFPAGITDYTPEVSRHLIELDGMQLNHVKAQVQVNDDNPPSQLFGSDADKKAWFLAHDKTLSDTKIDPGTIAIGDVSVEDKAGNPVNLATYPNELISGTLPKWTGCQTIQAVVVADLAFVKYADEDHKIPEVKPTAHPVRHSIKLTNAVTKINPPYTSVSFYDPGEWPPAGLAEAAYRGIAALQNAVQITFTRGQLRQDINLGMRLKLVGPNTTFSNVLVQSIIERPHYGETTINAGPVAAVDIDALISLARATRWRSTYRMPSGRDTGGTEGDGAIDGGNDVPVENTSHGLGGVKEHGVTFKQS